MKKICNIMFRYFTGINNNKLGKYKDERSGIIFENLYREKILSLLTDI